MHTKGPWQTHWTPDVTGYPCFYIHGFSGDEKRDVSTHDANARLIASAPDLLEALQLLIEAPTFEAYRVKARAALQKATIV